MSKYVALALLALVATNVGAKADDGDYEGHMFRLHRGCNAGDRRACVAFGIEIGKHQERVIEWRQNHPEWFWYEH